MKNYHLTKKNDLWKLTGEGNQKATKVFEGNKQDAIKESAEF